MLYKRLTDYVILAKPVHIRRRILHQLMMPLILTTPRKWKFLARPLTGKRVNYAAGLTGWLQWYSEGARHGLRG